MNSNTTHNNLSNKKILTGDRPTGPLHLGHYFGTLSNRVRLQNSGYECFIIIADYQVLTDRLDTHLIQENIIELAKDYLSVGMDPVRSTIFVQSQIPSLAELTVLLSMLVSYSRVSRNPTVKEEIRSMSLADNFSLVMFSYPVSQAADILLFNADLVPVGEDQLPHIELTREIAQKFNSTYGDVFNIPKPLLSDSPRLMGLDGQSKMSKSRNNAIFLMDDKDQIYQKIKQAKTDSGDTISFDPINKPNISNLLFLFSLVTSKKIKVLESEYNSSDYKSFKSDLSESISNFLKPIQSRRKQLSDEYIRKILADGTAKARIDSEITLRKVKLAMNFYTL